VQQGEDRVGACDQRQQILARERRLPLVGADLPRRAQGFEGRVGQPVGDGEEGSNPLTLSRPLQRPRNEEAPEMFLWEGHLGSQEK
jgi:hypothetical protein